MWLSTQTLSNKLCTCADSGVFFFLCMIFSNSSTKYLVLSKMKDAASPMGQSRYYFTIIKLVNTNFGEKKSTLVREKQQPVKKIINHSDKISESPQYLF